MTSLEIALLVVVAITWAILVRIHSKRMILSRNHMIMRHLFIQYSDWCARKIDEITESATWTIVDQEKASAQHRGHHITDDEARGAIPDIISNAKRAWEAEIDHLQAMLKHNNLDPLSYSDLDPWPFNRNLNDMKYV